MSPNEYEVVIDKLKAEICILREALDKVERSCIGIAFEPGCDEETWMRDFWTKIDAKVQEAKKSTVYTSDSCPASNSDKVDTVNATNP